MMRAADEMSGKICLVTGATSGLGRATALALGRLGASLVLVGRNERAAKRVLARLGKLNPAAHAEFLAADLSNMADVHRLAAEVRQRYSALDVLVNNAGARFDRCQMSVDGIELTFATNHLGHFLLTALLLDRLLAAPAARVVMVASEAHGGARVDASHGHWGDWIVGRINYDRRAAYAGSKLADVVFAYELARRLSGTSITSNAVDPGGVATHLARNNGTVAWFRHLAFYARKRQLLTPHQGARTIVYLASAPAAGGLTAKYFRELRQIRSSPASYDRDVATQLWRRSVELAGLNAALGKTWQYFKPHPLQVDDMRTSSTPLPSARVPQRG